MMDGVKKRGIYLIFVCFDVITSMHYNIQTFLVPFSHQADGVGMLSYGTVG